MPGDVSTIANARICDFGVDKPRHLLGRNTPEINATLARIQPQGIVMSIQFGHRDNPRSTERRNG